MATKKNRKPDLSALYALVGVADYALSQARGAADQAQTRALGLSGELRPSAVQARVTKTATDVRAQVVDLLAQLGDLPGTAQGQIDNLSADLESGYGEFVNRGEKVVGDLRNQPAAKRLSGAADDVTSDAKSAVRRVRKSADNAQARANAGVQAGRKQAAKGVAQLAGNVEDAAATLESEAETASRSAAAKQGAAKPASRSAARPSRKAVAKKATVKKAPAKKAASKKASASNSTASNGTPSNGTAKTASVKADVKVEAPKADSGN